MIARIVLAMICHISVQAIRTAMLGFNFIANPPHSRNELATHFLLELISQLADMHHYGVVRLGNGVT